MLLHLSTWELWGLVIIRAKTIGKEAEKVRSLFTETWKVQQQDHNRHKTNMRPRPSAAKAAKSVAGENIEYASSVAMVEWTVLFQEDHVVTSKGIVLKTRPATSSSCTAATA